MNTIKKQNEEKDAKGASEEKDRAPSAGGLGYVCTVCGWVYEGAILPTDLECPVCGQGANAFSPIEA